MSLVDRVAPVYIEVAYKILRLMDKVCLLSNTPQEHPDLDMFYKYQLRFLMRLCCDMRGTDQMLCYSLLERRFVA